MTRPARADRRSIVETTLTLRLTKEDRDLLQQLLALRSADLVEEGIEPTAASYLRGLIRREARSKGVTTRLAPP